MRLIDIDEIGVMPIDSTDLPYDECLWAYLKEDIDNAPTVKAIPLERVEQIRAEIEELEPTINHGFEGFYNCQNEVLKIIDKALKEQSE